MTADRAAIENAPVLLRGSRAAATARDGLTVKSAEDEGQAADLDGAMRDALEYLAAQEAQATRPMMQALQVVRGWFEKHRLALAAGRAAIRKEVGRWRAAEEARLEAERVRSVEQARAAAEAEADLYAEEAAPAAVAHVEAAEKAYGSSGSFFFTQRRVRFKGVVDAVEVARRAPHLVSVRASDAEAFYRAAKGRGEIDPDQPLKLCGMAFEELEIVAARRG